MTEPKFNEPLGRSCHPRYYIDNGLYQFPIGRILMANARQIAQIHDVSAGASPLIRTAGRREPYLFLHVSALGTRHHQPISVTHIGFSRSYPSAGGKGGQTRPPPEEKTRSPLAGYSNTFTLANSP